MGQIFNFQLSTLKPLGLAPLFFLATAATAAPKTFTVVGDKLAYRNVATVESESDFETFTGKTNAVSGSIKFDPQTKLGSGTLVVDAASIDTGIPLRNDHMRSSQWLDTEKFPKITFTSTKVTPLGGDNYRVAGYLKLHGKALPVTTTARVRYRANGAETKAAGFEGDVLQISTKFAIKLSDYGIVIPAQARGKVSNNVTLSLSAYAIAR